MYNTTKEYCFIALGSSIPWYEILISKSIHPKYNIDNIDKIFYEHG